ncbi:Predicted ATPase [Pseudomonas segetis]|uniref:Predicted ATPase n=1 Tax=Pseudomonas segetis TaxID=298908 RepID=A0A238ZY43_9PSED|nr:Predicted ATPase [Pseudomonas segetis]
MSTLRSLCLDEIRRFGSFSFYVQRRVVLQGDRPLRVGSKALDILHLLIENAGSVVSKEAIIAHVWPSTVVEDTNLRVHIAALRRVLGDGLNGQRYIVNIPQRGYSFVADVQTTAADIAGLEQRATAPTKLPALLTSIKGREAVIDHLVRQLPGRRLMTLVADGGMGKTVVAVRVAELVLEYYQDGVVFVDLAAVIHPSLLPAQVCCALGLSFDQQQPLECLHEYLHGRHLLLLLDNCEHLVNACAEMVEALLKNAPRLSILATSREPLLVALENVLRLPALTFAQDASGLSVADAMTYGAIQLFVQRVAAQQQDFSLNISDVPAVVDICRQLEGSPLAIELAAGYVSVFGLKGMCEQLNGNFLLAMQGTRTAFMRQHSLRASLDWSYALLTVTEQVILQRFALFDGAVTLEQAINAISCRHVSESDIFEAIVQLAAKSLLVVEMGEEAVHYRLLKVTRIYALEKLKAGEDFSVLRAEYVQQRQMRAIEQDRDYC